MSDSDDETVILKPLPLRNTGNDCWLNSLLQCLIWDDCYSPALVTYLPDHKFRAWKQFINNYTSRIKHQAQTLDDPDGQSLLSLAPLPSPKHLRFELFRNVSDTQEDSAEALLKLFSCLPDDTPAFCETHRTENMILHQDNDDNPHKPNYKCACNEAAIYKYDGSVCLEGEITRYLVPTDLVHHDLSPSNYSKIKFIDQDIPVLTVAHKFDLLMFKFPKDDTNDAKQMTNNSTISFDELFKRYRSHELSNDDEFDIKVIDPTDQIVKTYTCVWENSSIIIGDNWTFLPNTLIVNICRFEWKLNKESGDVKKTKIETLVDIPFQFNFASLFSNLNTPTRNWDYSEFNYEIFAFIQHIGSSIDSGHYISFVNTAPSDTLPHMQNWFCCNDSSITPVTNRQDLEINLQQAYIVFFRRCS